MTYLHFLGAQSEEITHEKCARQTIGQREARPFFDNLNKSIMARQSMIYSTLCFFFMRFFFV